MRYATGSRPVHAGGLRSHRGRDARAFAGDRDLLVTVAGAFLEHVPTLLDALADGLEREDRSAIQAAAHSIKGSVGNFEHAPAFDGALALEQLAAEAPMADLRRAHTMLRVEVSALTARLATIVSGPTAAPSAADNAA